MRIARSGPRGQTFSNALGVWFPTGELRINDGRLEQRFRVRVHHPNGGSWGEYFSWRAVPVVRSASGPRG
jgi:hypothetical protein